MLTNEASNAIFDRILVGQATETDIAVLRDELQGGRFKIEIGSVTAGDFQIGDRIYNGIDAETLRRILREIRDNRADLETIKQAVREALQFIFVTSGDKIEQEFNQTLKPQQWIAKKVEENRLTYFVDRPGEREQLIDHLLNSKKGLSNLIALWGAGGCGKTALALAVCCDFKVVEHFTGGIFWMDLGKEKDVVEEIKILYKQSTGLKALSNTANGLLNEFLNKWNDEPRLIVLDNLQNLEDLRQILLCGNTYCTWLITTRDTRSFAKMNPLSFIRVDILGITESTLILCYELHELYKLETEKLIEIFGKIQNLVAQLHGFPLLIDLIKDEIRNKLCGQQIDQEDLCVVLEELFDQIQQTGWKFYMKELSEIFKTSFGCLAEEEREALEELVIFPENQSIPLSILAKLWNLDKVDVRRYCDIFFGLSFLKTYSRKTKTIRINNVLRQYFLQNHEIREKRSEIHQKLLLSYERSYQISLALDSEVEMIRILDNLDYEDNEEKRYLKSFYQYHAERAK